MAWTPEHTTELIKLLDGGATAGTVARMLSKQFGRTFTRNMVLGKANRMKIPVQSGWMANQLPKSLRRAPRPAERQKPKLFPNPSLQGPWCDHSFPKGWRDEPGGIPLDQLEPGCCKWPFAGIEEVPERFCGEPTVKGFRFPYCRRHLVQNTDPTKRAALVKLLNEREAA